MKKYKIKLDGEDVEFNLEDVAFLKITAIDRLTKAINQTRTENG